MARKQLTSKKTKELFRDPSGQPHLFEKSYQEELEAKAKKQVECLGMTFENDEARRSYFLQKLKEKLKDPEFCKIEGFPIGSDENILVLSDPPYYTACPNPFIADFIKHYGKPYLPAEASAQAGDPNKPYSREPFAVDVSEGKTDQLYRAHGYHTKVPHLAIVPSILHYTEPGDVVLDGFCGSGMTGVAAHWCGTASSQYRREIEQRWEAEGRDLPEWGARCVILGDLSPAATFIAANYNLPFDVDTFSGVARKLLDEVEEEFGWMYETLHTDGKTKGRINYTVWSEVLSCPECAGQVVLVDEALDPKTKRVKDEFPWSHCTVSLTRKRLQQLETSHFDTPAGRTVSGPKRVPVLIDYTVGRAHYEKKPDARDLDLICKVENLAWPEGIPVDRMMHAPDDVDCWGDKWRSGTASFTHVHHLFLARAAHALGAMWHRAWTHKDKRLRNMLLFFIEQVVWTSSILNRYRPASSFGNGPIKGVYYVSSMIAEASAIALARGALRRVKQGFIIYHPGRAGIITTGDCARVPIPDRSVDYVFTDPPFGDNLAYAELNFVNEAFFGVFTNAGPEAVISSAQKKGLFEYQHLMRLCFEEYFRVLKPGRWMTVVFHNSKNAVWNAIQEAMLAAGFVVADVRTLDKQQGSFNQVVAGGAVKQDLVISGYKPNHGLEERFKVEAGTEEGVWDFVRTHLRQLPVFVSKANSAETIAERQNYLLFDRMVAFHVQRGVTVPVSAAEFYQGLTQRFIEREGMYFLPDQVAEYDKKRITVKEMLQLELFVTDESSAIQWLRQQLTKKPQTAGELKPQFMQEIGGWQKNEKLLELDELLAQNFLWYDGKGEVPSQIHSYLSTNFKELRNLAKDDPLLQSKAKDRWYVPDPNKAGDLEKLRERALLKEFDEYRDSKQRQLKVFRLEAVRAGFKKAWQEREYKTIIEVAQKIPENILQEDPKLLMWYDQAMTRTGGE